MKFSKFSNCNQKLLPYNRLSLTVLILERKTSVCWKSDYMLFTVMCPVDLLWGGGGQWE